MSKKKQIPAPDETLEQEESTEKSPMVAKKKTGTKAAPKKTATKPVAKKSTEKQMKFSFDANKMGRRI